MDEIQIKHTDMDEQLTHTELTLVRDREPIDIPTDLDPKEVSTLS